MTSLSQKKILLMRHAKSSWDQPTLRDFERPLNKRGEKDAPRMGRYLKKMGFVPDYVISSPAVRAKQTILLAANEMGLEEDQIHWDEDLYYESVDAYLKAIMESDDDYGLVMAVGHNPMIEQAIGVFSGRPVKEKVPTATIACFEAKVSAWKEVQPGNCELLWLITPKLIKS